MEASYDSQDITGKMELFHTYAWATLTNISKGGPSAYLELCDLFVFFLIPLYWLKVILFLFAPSWQYFNHKGGSNAGAPGARPPV